MYLLGKTHLPIMLKSSNRLFSLMTICLLYVIVIVGFVSTARAQAVKDEAQAIDESSVAFVYETKAEVPTSEDKLAGYISADYANAPDEFLQHRMMEKLRPIIKKRLDAAKATSTFVLRIAFQLPKYDFDRNGFPSAISEMTIVPFQNNYIVKF